MSFLQRLMTPVRSVIMSSAMRRSTPVVTRHFQPTRSFSVNSTLTRSTILRSSTTAFAGLGSHAWNNQHLPTGTRAFSTYGGYNAGQYRKPPANLGVIVVPQQSAYIVERFGRFNRTLEAGLHFLIPVIDRIAYVQNLKEEAIPVQNQMAITMDNVTINIDGVLYLKIDDPVKASYGVSDIYYAMVQLAQTTMRSELGKLTLDKTFAGREHLNADIVKQINLASEAWGVTCLRYEIKDINPPPGVKQAMDMQAEAERRKRATVLDSEGAQQSEINIAEGARQSAILEAEGEAQAIIAKATATAKGIQVLAQQLRQPGGREAVSLQVASQYVDAFGNIAKAGNTMLLPSNPGDAAGMGQFSIQGSSESFTQALAIYETIRHKNPPTTTASNPATANTQIVSSSSSTSPASYSSDSDYLTTEQQLFKAAERQVMEEERQGGGRR